MERPHRGGGEGDVQPGSEHPFSSQNPPTPQRSIDEQIRAFRPWEAQSTTHLRCRLNKAAVCSAAHGTRSESPHSRCILWLANEIASKWLWAKEDDEQLRDVLHGINQLVMAAYAFERNGSGL